MSFEKISQILQEIHSTYFSDTSDLDWAVSFQSALQRVEIEESLVEEILKASTPSLKRHFDSTNNIIVTITHAIKDPWLKLVQGAYMGESFTSEEELASETRDVAEEAVVLCRNLLCDNMPGDVEYMLNEIEEKIIRNNELFPNSSSALDHTGKEHIVASAIKPRAFGYSI